MPTLPEFRNLIWNLIVSLVIVTTLSELSRLTQNSPKLPLQYLKGIDIQGRLHTPKMFTLITVTLSLFFIGLTGWTFTTYLVKEDSQKFIKEELKNLFENCKMLFLSIKTLIGVLTKHSFSSGSVEERPA